MIPVKSAKDIKRMREACRITALALKAAGQAVQPGVTTMELDAIVRGVIEQNGARPSFLGYNGFPASACISLNETVIHGIPDGRRIKEGDIVSVDVGAYYDGFHGDCADTFYAGRVSEQAQALVEATRQSFYEGVRFAREGYRVSDLSHAIQSFVESKGFSVVRSFTGHGVGEQLHEEPEVPNFGLPGHGARFLRGMTVAVEPMVNEGSFGVKILGDRWTVVTEDGGLSAHYEHTVLITDGEPELLTLLTQDGG